ncbi:type II toxin-antitoxin system Phd/YefM family antitoxin [Kitasatospora sp. NPDC127111]|uniref:type II toxin-antitoxin system Phd/YefM family antitoxin n=1 Tax=Kitasatospora sp. NPDC127111 TaxID=3345363 RepID=UPI00363A1773
MTTEPQGRPDLPANVPAVALADARAELSKIVTLAEHTGRITAITRYGKPVAAVVPAALLHLLSGANIGPRPIEASEMERMAARARAAGQRPSSEDITAAVDDVRNEALGAEVLVGTDTMTEGIDVPSISALVVQMPALGQRVREVLAQHGSVAPQDLTALPEDLTMADLLEAWAEKQRGGSR